MVELALRNYKNRHSLGSKIARVAWNVVWLFCFRTTPRGCLFRKWRVLLLKIFGAKVDWSCDILPSCRIWQPWRLEMDRYATLGQHVDCYNVNWIRLGCNATVSQDAFLCTASHDISSPTMELISAPINIGSQSWVCARAVLLPGVTIGEGAVVGCAAVVTKNVESWSVVGGNPARYLQTREIRT